MNSASRNTFLNPVVKHCILHTFVSAVPSFVMAVMFGWNRTFQLAGMVAGIIAFMITAIAVHFTKPMKRVMDSRYSGLALTWGKRLRLIHAIILLPCFFSGSFLFWVAGLDFWAGVLANQITEKLGFSSINTMRSYEGVSIPSIADQFSQSFIATFIEGWILAFAVSILCFLIWFAMRLLNLVRPQSTQQH